MAQDILIIGGGPAGLSTALHLAVLAPDLIPRVLVIERAHYPRHKLCAGALTSDAEVLLRQLGLDIGEVPHVDAAEAHLDFAGRGLKIAPRGTHALRIIRRNEFDAWLAAHVRRAGIEIREGVVARRIERTPDRVLVRSDSGDFDALVLVGADGSAGITRRSILPDDPSQTARALEVLVPSGREHQEEWKAGASTRGPSRHASDAAYFDMSPVPLGIAGYTWDFPTQVDGRPMRCWGIYDSNLMAGSRRPALKHPLELEMQRQRTTLEGLALQGHPIRWFSPRSQLSVPRVVLVGDAAGADGIFGEGISFALGYGRIAAGAIRDAFAANDFSFRDYRGRVLRSALGRALIARSAITQTIYGLRWSWFQAFFWHTLKPVIAAVSFIAVMNWARRMR